MNNKANITSFKKGHKPSVEAVNKMRLAKLGKPSKSSASFKKGMVPWNKGLKGVMKPNKTSFKKGSTPSNKGKGMGDLKDLQRHWDEYKIWRNFCFKRDNFTCQKYGISGGRLVVHHINNFADFPELRFSVDNGITLSEKAHLEFHKLYGRRNNTLEQLQDYLKNYGR